MNKQPRLIACLLTAIAFGLAVTTASADTINVPGDYPTIQEAINAAVNGDQVVVAPGTYVNEGLATVEPKNVVVRSSSGPDVTIIREEVQSVNAVHVAHDGYSWEGFTFTSVTTLGGVVLGVSSTFTDCVFRGCFSDGAIVGLSGGYANFNNCIFTGNRRHGVSVNSTSDARFTSCVASGNVNSGFECDDNGVNVGTFIDCTARWNQIGFDMVGGELSGCTACGNVSNFEGWFYDGGGNLFLAKCPIEENVCEPDITGDGNVTFEDLLVVLSNWGPCPQ